MKALILARNGNTVSSAQLYPFLLFKDELAARFDFNFIVKQIVSLNEVDLTEANSFDIVFIQLKIAKDNREEQFISIFKQIKCKKILLDDSDSTGTCVFNVSEFVDLYIKNQALTDLNGYDYSYPNNRYHAYQIINTLNRQSAQLSTLEIPTSFKDKLFVGWNLGVIRSRYKKIDESSFNNQKRSIDVCAGFSLGEMTGEGRFNDLYYLHRKKCLDEVQKLPTRFKVHASKVTRDIFYEKLRGSKVAVSPWGNGEVCYRDFEIILSGALLVKPSMDHVETNPNIFISHQTYVPVRPDFSDLSEICEHYLTDEKERLQIVHRSKEVYEDYFRHKTFLSQMEQVLRRVGLR